MKRIQYYIIGFMTLALAAVACSVDDRVADYTSAISLTSDGDIEWTQGDKISLSIYNSTGVVLDNVEFYNSATNGTYSTFYPTSIDNTLYWAEFTKSDQYVAFYPYSSDIVDYKLSLDLSDQSSYHSLDMVVARGALSGVESGLEFSHLLSMLSVKIELGDMYVAEELQWMEVDVTSPVATSARYNLITGILATDVVATDESVYVSNVYFDEATSTINCLVLPQSGVSEVELSFSNIYVGDRSVKVSIPDGYIDSDKEYSAIATLSQSGVSMSETTITPWDNTTTEVTATKLYTPVLYDYVLQNGTFIANADGVAYSGSDANNTNPIVGLVYYISETKGESYAMSIEETYGYFTTASGQLPVTQDLDDGRVNMDAYLAADPTLEKYIPVKFCYDLNNENNKTIIAREGYADQTGVWYLPAQKEVNNEFFYALIPTFDAEQMGLYRDVDGVQSEMLMGSTKQGVVCTDCEEENKINLYLYQVGGDIFGTGVPTLEGDGMSADYYNLVEYSLFRYSNTTEYSAAVRYWCSNVNGATNPFYISVTRSSNGSDTSAATGYANGAGNAQGHSVRMKYRAVMKF